MIERLKKHQKEFKELHELGVLGVTTKDFHLNIDLFLELAKGDFDVISRDSEEFPYEFIKIIDGVKILAIMTLGEYQEIKNGAKEGELNE